MQKFKNLFEVKKTGFDLQKLSNILYKEGYDQYDNPMPNKMHEFQNKRLIISIGADSGGNMSIFRVRDFDVKNGITFRFDTYDQFTEIIKNKSLREVSNTLKRLK